MYQQWRSATAGVTVWRHTTSAQGTVGGARPQPILPDGCLDVIWNGREAIVAGPDTQVQVSWTTPGQVVTGVRFAPGTGPRVIGVPASEVRDQRVPLGDLWADPLARQVVERLARAPDPAVALQDLAASRLRQAGPPDPVVGAIVTGVRAGAPVAQIAEAVGLSQRQLHRICCAAFGYGAKTLARILRMDRAVALARGGGRFAEIAAATGYADQAHLSREVRALTGVPLGQLVR